MWKLVAAMPWALPSGVMVNNFGNFNDSSEIVDAFRQDGFVIIRGAFPHYYAQACREHLSNVLWAPNQWQRPLLAGEVTGFGVYRGGNYYRSSGLHFHLEEASGLVRNMTYRLNDPHIIPEPNPWNRFIFDKRIIKLYSLLSGEKLVDISGYPCDIT